MASELFLTIFSSSVEHSITFLKLPQVPLKSQGSKSGKHERADYGELVAGTKRESENLEGCFLSFSLCVSLCLKRPLIQYYDEGLLAAHKPFVEVIRHGYSRKKRQIVSLAGKFPSVFGQTCFAPSTR